MHLLAVLVPPPEVVEQVRSVVAGVPVAVPEPLEPPVPPTPAGRHRLFRKAPEPPPPEPPPPPPVMLDLIEPGSAYLRITTFGNLSLRDATRLADALDVEAESWAAPRLHCSGGVALEPEGDDSVWARIAGDVDELAAVARGIPQVAQRLQLFVDRRRFRPLVQLGTITEHTTVPYLEDVLAALEGTESAPWWQTTFSLVVPAQAAPGELPFRTFRDVALGTPVTR